MRVLPFCLKTRECRGKKMTCRAKSLEVTEIWVTRSTPYLCVWLGIQTLQLSEQE